MRLRATLYDLWRQLAGRYSIDDPRPIAEAAPYTYFLPSDDQVRALAPGDQAKLVFRSHVRGSQWDAERMWVTITEAGPDILKGRLDNQPRDMPQLRPGTPIVFKRTDVIDILWDAERAAMPPPPVVRREYWDRCMVDSCVVEGRSPVDYLYRDTPDMAAPGDKDPDSGWRIRGTDEGIADDERESRGPKYVALGAVLNRDDSWLHLIDAAVGARYLRDPKSGAFVQDSAD